MMNYGSLRTRALQFLRGNPEIQSVTITRPPKMAKLVYATARKECWGRIPETCPKVEELLLEHLPDDFQIVNDRGIALNIPHLRAEILESIRMRVTKPFRDSLEEVCDHKHNLLLHLKNFRNATRDIIDGNETERPETSSEEEDRKRSRKNIVVQAGAYEEDDV